jgi:aminoglycoside phosphotransferase family enzyme/predicted kinase
VASASAGLSRPPPGGGHDALDDDLPAYVSALLRPSAFRHPADDIQLVDTHISWVILAGAYVYKIKKPVSFGFLDFSTVERRAADCAAEVRLNRRLCPDVYLGVVDIVERGGDFSVGGEGRVVEPAVWMRRLPAEGMLDQMLKRDAVDASLARRIARRLARFHAIAATGPGVDEFGTPRAVKANWDENFVEVAPFVGRTLSPSVAIGIQTYVEGFLVRRGALLEQRVATHRVRDGHGDLHAASVCVEGRRLQLFDCLEFSPRFRCADVAADVAFLAMDFDHYGRADLAAAYVEAYVTTSRDRDLLLLLDFYKCYRAYVRGKVLSLRLLQPGLTPERSEQIAADAAAYFDLAWAYAGGVPERTLIVVTGSCSEQQTELARGLARRLGLVYLTRGQRDDDELVSDRAVSEQDERPEAPDPADGAAGSDRGYALVRRRAASRLRHQQPVILDLGVVPATERFEIADLAARLGARFIVLRCKDPSIVANGDDAVREPAEEAAWLVDGSASCASHAGNGLCGAVLSGAVDVSQSPEAAIRQALEIIRG